MENKQFGKWLVVKQIKNGKPGRHYECSCQCGNFAIIPGVTLRAGRSKQCSDCQYKTLYNPDRMIGNKFGKWTITKFIDIHRSLQRFECVCDCGTKGIHCAADLRAGKSTQCTICHNRENAVLNIKHGMHAEKIYKVWCSMLSRCRTETTTGYKYYGGRGITVCERWYKFENFFADMGMPEEGLTIDRIDNNGNYEKDNCRWVTHKENCNNRYY